MAAKRPSYVSIRARQRRILDYQLSTGKNDRQAAKEFGVTPGQLKKFTTSNPKTLRRSYNLNKKTQKLFSEGEPKHVRRMVRKEHVPYQRTTEHLVIPTKYHAATFEREELSDREIAEREEYWDREYQVRERAEFLYAWETNPAMMASHQWEVYTDAKGLPRSKDAIDAMYLRGELSDEDYDDITDVWREVYNVQASGAA